jgi:hypothetical protein
VAKKTAANSVKLAGRVLLRQSTVSLLSCRLAFLVLKDPRARFSGWRLSTIWFDLSIAALVRRATSQHGTQPQLQLKSGPTIKNNPGGSGTSCAVGATTHMHGFVNLYFPSLLTPELCPLATAEPASPDPFRHLFLVKRHVWRVHGRRGPAGTKSILSGWYTEP